MIDRSRPGADLNWGKKFCTHWRNEHGPASQQATHHVTPVSSNTACQHMGSAPEAPDGSTPVSVTGLPLCDITDAKFGEEWDQLCGLLDEEYQDDTIVQLYFDESDRLVPSEPPNK